MKANEIIYACGSVLLTAHQATEECPSCRYIASISFLYISCTENLDNIFIYIDYRYFIDLWI